MAKIVGHALYTDTHMLAWREDEGTYRLCKIGSMDLRGGVTLSATIETFDVLSNAIEALENA